MENSNHDFLPRHSNARLAVERARQTVRDNHEFIQNLKYESDLISKMELESAPEDEVESHFNDKKKIEFDLSQIKTSNGISDIFREIFPF